MKVSIKKLEDRDHFVVPVVMLTVGVHCGSRGPIFYPADELDRTAPYWNGKPVVIYHPCMYSDGFAGNPEVFNRQKVGTIFNASFDGHRLKAEAWLDVQRVEALDRRVAAAIRSRSMMEVSTGLVCGSDSDGYGTFNGEEYESTARNIVPDHLAILPDQIGACSIADGAGLMRNQLHHGEILLVPATA
ncbi:MAG TPA: DUF2213 domain-containing protein [Lacunisphaera sp.]|nr:DUF2213 domain-containing protein [Lacunisphaera sp.]